MSDTTQGAVLAIAPELATVSQNAWDAVLADVALQVGSNWGRKQEIGQRYLAAHRLTLIARADKGGQVMAERTGDVSTSYAASGGADYAETAYGREFERLRRGAIAGFMTVTP
jgi:hypothetical protein